MRRANCVTARHDRSSLSISTTPDGSTPASYGVPETASRSVGTFFHLGRNVELAKRGRNGGGGGTLGETV